jgi:Mn-dependent DtxR family transcriptional regulator
MPEDKQRYSELKLGFGPETVKQAALNLHHDLHDQIRESVAQFVLNHQTKPTTYTTYAIPSSQHQQHNLTQVNTKFRSITDYEFPNLFYRVQTPLCL